jgi:hypothetical protein
MATNPSAELGTAFYNPYDGGLDEFEPEVQRAVPLWIRAPVPSADDIGRQEPYVSRLPDRSWLLALPVAIATALVGAVWGWSAVRPVARQAPPAPHAAAVAEPVSAEGLTTSIPIPAPVPQVAPAAPPVERIAAHPSEPGFERTLAFLSESYRARDASSLADVWPGADTEALAARFAALKYQSLTFDRCRLTPNGPTGAMAACEVSLAEAPKEGEPSLQRRRESWTLALDRTGDRWTIAGVTIR